MKAIKYKIEIYGNTLSYVHNMPVIIDEIYIENLCTFINFDGEKIHVFFINDKKTIEDRLKDIKKLKEIEINDVDIEKIETLRRCEDLKKELQKDLFI